MGSRSRSRSPPGEDRRPDRNRDRRRERRREEEESPDHRRGDRREKHRHHRQRGRSRSGSRDRREDREGGRRREVKEEPASPPRVSRGEDRRQGHPAEGLREEGSAIKKEEKEGGEEGDKLGPDFKVSGKLLEDTNVFNGVVIKYSEPPEARKPKKRWRLYVFKGEETMPVLHMHRQSAYLMGKDRKIVDIPIDHPSCSRQHAVFQYRLVKKDGLSKILPYIIDLGSSNGTFLNNKRIEAQRYHELREKDVLKFGYSSREYVLLHDQSKDNDEFDD